MNRYVAQEVRCDESYFEVDFNEGQSLLRVPIDKMKIAVEVHRSIQANRLTIPSKCPDCGGKLTAWFRSSYSASVHEADGQPAFEYIEHNLNVKYELGNLINVDCDECGVQVIAEGPAA